MTKKIDKRKTYYLTIDTETANGLNDPIVYDIGGCIHDKYGNIYATFSFIIYETFYEMRDLMESAYYSNKIPQYEEQIKKGERKVVRFNTAKQTIKQLCDEYRVKAIIAHNARFDYRSTTKTERYLTKSKYRYFLPYGIPIWDSLKMAKDTICKQPTYYKWCVKNNFLTKKGKPRATAEILYKYITKDLDFKESHTGLEDVFIEIVITCKCIAQHKPMRKECFA